jgi:hypothetical protein
VRRSDPTYRPGTTAKLIAAEQTLSLLDPLWHWLQEHHRGLVQADGEGFYEHQRLILATR